MVQMNYAVHIFYISIKLIKLMGIKLFFVSKCFHNIFTY